MAPDASLQRQNEYYRKMTGEMRFQIALDLHAFSSKLARGSLSAAAQARRPTAEIGDVVLDSVNKREAGTRRYETSSSRTGWTLSKSAIVSAA